MTDRKSGIGKITHDRQQGFGIADGYGSDNGDGYLSDVQTYHSNNPSEVSQDFYSSTRILEQQFKDKYKFLRHTYEQRMTKFSDVVQLACENLFTDELLHEMMGEKISSVFIPAHISEVINRHLESDREHFIHRLISQLSSAKIDLLKCQETIVQRGKIIASLEPEVLRGKKSQSGMDSLQKQLIDLKRQFDQLTVHSDEKLNVLQTRNVILEEQDRVYKENFSKIVSELSLKSSEVESLRRNVTDKTRDCSLLQTSFVKAVEDEVRLKLTSYLSVKDDSSLEIQELKMQAQLKVDELIRIQDALRSKTEEEQKSRCQLSSIMNQVEVMLEDEASESNKTINAIHAKMKLLKSRLSSELQQEKRLTAVLQAEIGNILRDKEGEIRLCHAATEEAILLREKLSAEVQKSTALQTKSHECYTLFMEAKAKIMCIENNLKLVTEELGNVKRLKTQEIKVEVSKARIEAVHELEIERSKIDELVEVRTGEFKRDSERQLRTLQNQMRHSYTFGSMSKEYDNLNEMRTQNKIFNQSYTNGPTSCDKNNDSNTLAADLSLQLAMRTFEEKSAVAKILLESEHLIAKAKAEAKVEIAHQGVVKELQEKLQEAGGNIKVLKQMVMRLRITEEENTVTKQRNNELLSDIRSLQDKLYAYERGKNAFEQKIKFLEEEIFQEKSDCSDLRNQLVNATRINPMNECGGEDRNMEKQNIAEEIRKNQDERKLNEEIKSMIDSDKEIFLDEKRKIHVENRSLQSENKRSKDEYEFLLTSKKLIEEHFGVLQKDLLDQREEFRRFEEKQKKVVEEYVEKIEMMRVERDDEIEDKKGINQLMLYKETIRNKEKEDWENIEIRQRNDIEKLRKKLEETQEQSLKDQGHDAAALEEMNRKFENLMLNYDVNVTAVKDKIEFNKSHLQYTDGILESQKNKIKLLEETVNQKIEMLLLCSKEILWERTAKNEANNQNQALKRIIVQMKCGFENELRVLHVDLMKTREGCQSMELYIQGETNRMASTFGDVIHAFLDQVSRTHEIKVRTIKSALISNHESKMQMLESTLTQKIDALVKEISEREKDLCLAADSHVNIAYQSREENHYGRDQSTQNIYGNIADQSIAEINESHGSLSASILSDECPVPAYESVMKGLIAALELSGLCSSCEIRELVSLAIDNRQPSVIAATSAQRLLGDYLNKHLIDVKKLKFEIVHLQKKLKFETDGSQRGKENNIHLRERMGHALDAVDLSEIHSVTSSSNAFDIAAGELEQSRNEQSLLLDLAKIGSEAQIKNLVTQMEELRKQKETDMINARAESSELEIMLKASFQEEYDALKSEASHALESAQKELKYEHSRRQQLQNNLIESESHLLNKIQLLEEANMDLRNKADQADLESTRLKMTTLHDRMSQGL